MDNNALQKISYGLYVVCSKKENNYNGQIANAIFQVTATPPTIALSINKQNCTHDYIQNSGKFTISILSNKTPMKFIGTFGFQCGRDINKFEGISIKTGKNDVPIILDYTIGYIEANLIESIDVFTHTIFIGKITEANMLSEGTPMTYEYYHIIKGGKSPKNAPTYYDEKNMQKKKNMEENQMKKYVCDVCGYVYDPKAGDPDNNIAAGTAFEDLPDDWTCPICGAPKSEFSEEE